MQFGVDRIQMFFFSFSFPFYQKLKLIQFCYAISQMLSSRFFKFFFTFLHRPLSLQSRHVQINNVSLEDIAYFWPNNCSLTSWKSTNSSSVQEVVLKLTPSAMFWRSMRWDWGYLLLSCYCAKAKITRFILLKSWRCIQKVFSHLAWILESAPGTDSGPFCRWSS